MFMTQSLLNKKLTVSITDIDTCLLRALLSLVPVSLHYNIYIYINIIIFLLASQDEISLKSICSFWIFKHMFSIFKLAHQWLDRFIVKWDLQIIQQCSYWMLQSFYSPLWHLLCTSNTSCYIHWSCIWRRIHLCHKRGNIATGNGSFKWCGWNRVWCFLIICPSLKCMWCTVSLALNDTLFMNVVVDWWSLWRCLENELKLW